MKEFFEDRDLILSILLDNCNKKYHKTKEAGYMKEKLEKMEENCKNMLLPDDVSFVEDCFSVLCEAEGAKIEHAYRQGYKDCICVLKMLEIL